MAKVKFRVTDSETGESIEKVVEDTEIPAKQKLAAERGVVFELIDTELSPEEQTRISVDLEQPTTRRSAFMGGILQGLSLGTEDEVRNIFGDDTETLRRRQQAERPVAYGAGKFIGGLLPTAGFGALGAKAGGAMGSPGGPIGAVSGATLGALLGAAGAGTFESYFSRPKQKRKLLPTEEDVGMGVLSAVGEGVGRAVAPLARVGLRNVAGRVIPSGVATRVGAVEASDIAIKEATERLNAAEKKVRDLATQFEAGMTLRKELGRLAAKHGGKITKQAAEEERERLASAGVVLSIPQIQQGVKAEAELVAAEALYNQVLKQIPARAGSVGGALGAAVPMAVPEGEMTPSEMMEFDRLSVDRAIEQAKRKKLMELNKKPTSQEEARAIEEEKMKRLMALTPRQ